MPAPSPRPARSTKWLLIAATALFVVLKMLHAVLAVSRHSVYGPEGPRIIHSNDTDVYLAAARGAIFSKQFLESRGPFGYALFLKLLASNLRAAVVVQTALSTAAWLYLAHAVRRAVTNDLAGAIGFLGVLATGFGPGLMMWDAAAMTECLSIALVCVVVGLALRLATAATTRTAVLFASTLAVASLTRDLNAFLALGIGAAACVALLMPRLRRAQWRRLVIVATVSIASATLAIGLSSAANRSFWPVTDSIVLHVARDATGYKFLLTHGIPTDGEVKLLAKTYGVNQVQLDRNVPRFLPFKHWLEAHGSSVYYRWLISHPVWTLTRPLGRLTDLFSPPTEPVAKFWGNDPDVISRTIGRVVGLPWVFTESVWAALAAIGLIVVMVKRRPRNRDRRVAWTTIAVGALAVPHAIAVYHGDALENARHAVSLAAQARIAVWIATAFVIDQLIQWRKATAA